MASGREAISQRDPAIRRVAIVLQSLPEPVAAKLLGTFGPADRRKLQQAMSQLTDVDPMERRLALQSFKGSLRTGQNSARTSVSGEDEISIGGNRAAGASSPLHIHRAVGGQSEQQPAAATNRLAEATAGAASTSLLAFLNDVPDQPLADLLVSEHPQTIALVLASIAPAHAARVLPRLSETQRQRTMERIGRLGEIPNDSLQEIADHLRSRVEAQRTDDQTSSGQKALTAILAELTSSNAAQTGSTAEMQSPSQPQLYTDGNEAVAQMRRLQQLRDEVNQAADGKTPVGAAGAASNRQTQQMPIATRDVDHHFAESTGPAANESDGDWHTPPHNVADDYPSHISTEAIDRHLTSLSPLQLCQALGRVDTRQALLTLCGLPTELADAVLAILPRSRERMVRRQLSRLGELQLREIDEAKEVVARLTSVAEEPVVADTPPSPLAA